MAFSGKNNSGGRGGARKSDSRGKSNGRSGRDRRDDRKDDSRGNRFEKKDFKSNSSNRNSERGNKPYFDHNKVQKTANDFEEDYQNKKKRGFEKPSAEQPYKRDFQRRKPEGKRGGKVKLTPQVEHKSDDGMVRLNRYIAQAGVCSRREADELITSGVISVNGKIVTELGTKVHKTDKVKYEDQTLKNEKLVYFLLNKPKDYITTVSDPEKRRTVLDLMKGACKERIYPVGRLDRNTSGILLLTNDGDLSKKLMHPKHLVKKIYQVSLDKSITQEDFFKVKEGIQLEDGFIKPDELAYTSKDTKKELGIEIHSGKNRIVRRIFESLGYKVVRLDRTYFAGLTKKGMSRGQYKALTEEEIKYLKMLG